MKLAQIDSRNSKADLELDLELIFQRHARRLRQAVARHVDAPEEVIDEACQQAWARLVTHAGRIDPSRALPWLVTTAIHAALRQLDSDRRCRSLDELMAGGEDVLGPSGAQCEQALESSQTLQAIDRLPVRQQRVLWLRGLGLSYEEVAGHEACTVRTVQRQLVKARATVRLAVGT